MLFPTTHNCPKLLLFNVYVLFVCFRAAQKLNLSSSPHRRRRSGDDTNGQEETQLFPNGYAAILQKSPPPAPPALLRRIGVKELTGVGKVKDLFIYIQYYYWCIFCQSKSPYFGILWVLTEYDSLTLAQTSLDAPTIERAQYLWMIWNCNECLGVNAHTYIPIYNIRATHKLLSRRVRFAIRKIRLLVWVRAHADRRALMMMKWDGARRLSTGGEGERDSPRS